MESVLAQLERIATLASEAGLKTLAAELTEERIPTLRSGRLNMVVLGEFNHGKSTLINALLGAEVLPTGITPTTAVITRLTYGTLPAAEVEYADGRCEQLTLDALKQRVRDENAHVRHVEVRYPSDLLANQVELIDTPGVNDISQQKVEVTYGIVPRADIVLFLLDANQVLKQSELRFIEKRLLTGLRDRLIFVISKIDRLHDDEALEVTTYVRERLEAMLGPVEIFPVSARNADNDPGFAALRAHITAFLERQRRQILLDSALGTGLRSGSSLLGNLQIKRRGYQLARADLQTRVDAVQKKLHESQRVIAQNVARIEETCDKLSATALHNLHSFRDEFLAALPREIEKVSADDVQRHLPGFIEDCFRRYLEREGRALARALELLAEEIIAITNENLRETVDALQREMGVDASALRVEVDSTAYDVSVFAMGAFGVSILLFINAIVGGLIALATPVVALVLKDKLEARVKKKATDIGLKAIRVAADRAELELARLVADFGVRLKAFVEDAGDRLYRQIDEALRAVVSERDAVGADQTQLDARAARTEDRARDIVNDLRARRDALWGEDRP